MSFGNSHNGGRTRMKTRVLLNVYDLSPANEYLYPIGFGLHHTGIEIDGREYSFGSGSGIFDGPPKEAPGAKFRQQIEMGSFDGGTKELNMELDYLRDNGFGPGGYNLVRRNCNHFCNALVWRLLRKPIPPHINRLADIGNCCSCLLPKQLLEDSPVGGTGGGSGGGNSSNSRSFFVPTNASMNRGGGGGGGSESNPAKAAFSGTGMSLGGTASTSGSSTDSSGGGSGGFLSSWSKPTHTAQTQDDLTDRREKARKAALARLERNQQQQQQNNPGEQ